MERSNFKSTGDSEADVDYEYEDKENRAEMALWNGEDNYEIYCELFYEHHYEYPLSVTSETDAMIMNSYFIPSEVLIELADSDEEGREEIMKNYIQDGTIFQL
jgi:hypothetical protein